MVTTTTHALTLCRHIGPVPTVCVVRRQKERGIGFHFGLLLPDGRVADVMPERGIAIVSFDEFACGFPVTRLSGRQAPWNAKTVARFHAARIANRPYDVANWNCETFANWVITGKATSGEVTAWVAIIGALAILFLNR